MGKRVEDGGSQRKGVVGLPQIRLPSVRTPSVRTHSTVRAYRGSEGG